MNKKDIFPCGVEGHRTDNKTAAAVELSNSRIFTPAWNDRYDCKQKRTETDRY